MPASSMLFRLWGLLGLVLKANGTVLMPRTSKVVRLAKPLDYRLNTGCAEGQRPPGSARWRLKKHRVLGGLWRAGHC